MKSSHVEPDLRAHPDHTCPLLTEQWHTRPSFWRRTLTFAGLLVLGVTPWAHAQLPEPNEPAYCPPLTSIANPTLFDMFWGTTPIRWPFQ